MANVFQTMKSIFKIPELKRRVLYTLTMLIIYRVGAHVPTAGVNGEALANYFKAQQGSLLGLYDMFVGGAFSQATIFALGIMPYISASIILQLFTAVIPYFEDRFTLHSIPLKFVLALRIEGIAQPVAEEVHGEQEEHHRECRIKKPPRVEIHPVDSVAHQRAPGGERCLDADPEKRQKRLEHDKRRYP